MHRLAGDTVIDHCLIFLQRQRVQILQFLALCMTLELKCWRYFYNGASVQKYRVKKQDRVCVKLWKELPLPGTPVFLFRVQHRSRHDTILKARLSCLTHFIYYYSKNSSGMICNIKQKWQLRESFKQLRNLFLNLTCVVAMTTRVRLSPHIFVRTKSERAVTEPYVSCVTPWTKTDTVLSSVCMYLTAV